MGAAPLMAIQWPECQKLDSRCAALSWARAVDQGFSKGASSLFLPAVLACLASQVVCPRGPYLGLFATNFWGNAGGHVLKGSFFP